MKIFNALTRRRGIVLAALLSLSVTAQAQSFPTKPIRILVG